MKEASKPTEILVVRPEGHQKLGDLALERIRGSLEQHGAVIFRGFAPSKEEFLQLTAQHAPGVERGVLPNENALEFHGELYWTPFPPDVLWFYCTLPATVGGRTFVSDGELVTKALSDAALHYFEGSPLVYNRIMQESAWKRLFRVKDGDELLERTAAFPNLAVVPWQDGRAFTSLITPAIRGSRWRKRASFVNSLLHAIDSRKRPDLIAYGLANEIPTDFVEEVRDIVWQCSSPVEWERFDVVMLDNTRMMHARESYSGPRELIGMNGVALF